MTVWDTEYEALPAYTKAINEIDAEFEKLHPGVEVEREAQPLETYESLLRAAFTAGEGPDMMLMQPGYGGVLNFTKGFEVLNDQLDPELQKELTQWGSTTPSFTDEGDRYGVPIGLFGLVYYYNKALFKKANLPTNFQPKTWAEVREAGEKLRDAGIQPFVGGNKEGFENVWWLSQGLQTATTPAQRTEFLEGKVPWTDEMFTQAFQPEFEMEEADLYDPAERYSKGFVAGCADFADGKGGMILGFWNAVCDWSEFNASLGERKVGFFFPPGSAFVAPYAAVVMSIPTFAKNKEAALALLEFEASAKGMKILDEVGNFMSNRTDLEPSADAPIQERELVAAARKGPTETAPLMAIPGPIAYGPVATEISSALQGRTSLEHAQQAMQETAEKTVE